jgi:ABC-type uncharacterized transport system involved in gliding motility auxiliary subunit
MRAPASWALAAGYPQHPVTRNFNLVTVFPYARAIGLEENETWQRTTLVEAAPRGWVSSRPMKNKPVFDKNHDIPGPATIAVALQRDVNERDQRIVVVGSGSFLANAYSGNSGNIDFGINMVNWLANEEKLISMQPRAVKDGTITLSKTKLSVITASFLLGLPAFLMLVGCILWWRNGK